MKNSITVLYTGGTIGMLPSGDGFKPQAGFKQRLRGALSPEQIRLLPDFRVIELKPAIDSANILPNDWSRIVSMIVEHWTDADGFVILHGTDTMAYTASALSFMMLGLNKPVVLTGSHIPIVAAETDAISNIMGALKVAANGPSEVSLYFNGKLLRGNRSRKVGSLSTFDSPNCPPLAHMDTSLPTLTPINRTAQDFCAPAFVEGTVAFLPLFPGQSTAQAIAVLSDMNVRGVVLESYGVGNPPDQNATLMRGLQDACNRGIVVVNITQCQTGRVNQETYATGQRLLKLGIIGGQDMTRECAITKLQVLLAKGVTPYDLKNQMAQSLAGELSLL